MPPREPSPPTDWSNVADWYDDLVGEAGSEFHRHVVLPGALKLLDAKAGQRVLDVACGQGVLCRLLAAKNIECTGVDAARDLIQRARKLNDSLPTAECRPPTYLVADARELLLPPDSFDAAACLLAIQNIHPIKPVFEGVARALKPAGRFVMVMMHPCFRGHKETCWGWDAAVQYRRVDKYLQPRKSPIVAHPGKKNSEYTWSFHKPIGEYVKALRSAGLLVDAIEEWPSHKKSDSGPRARAENIARAEIPMFMAMRAVKTAGLGV